MLLGVLISKNRDLLSERLHLSCQTTSIFLAAKRSSRSVYLALRRTSRLRKCCKATPRTTAEADALRDQKVNVEGARGDDRKFKRAGIGGGNVEAVVIGALTGATSQVAATRATLTGARLESATSSAIARARPEVKATGATNDAEKTETSTRGAGQEKDVQQKKIQLIQQQPSHLLVDAL